MNEKVNLADKLSLFDEHWQPKLRDRDVELDEGDLFVVPCGVEHCPRAEEEAAVLLLEPIGTINTGDAGGALTAKPQRI